MRRLLLLLAVTAGLLVGSATAASAHATLESTTPLAGATLSSPPTTVELTFSEPVELGLGAVRVYDAKEKRVDDGHTRHADSRHRVVTVGLVPLTPGGYVVTWRVVSADSHPVQGAFTFSVGSGADVSRQAADLLGAQGGSAAVGFLFATVRWLAFLALVLGIGGAAFVLFVSPATRERPLAQRVVWGALVGLGVVSLAGVAVQGVYAAGLPLSRIADHRVLTAVLHTRFGRVWTYRAVLAGAGGLVLRPLLRSGGFASRVVAGATGLGVLLMSALAGHAGSGSQWPLATAMDAVHLAAVSVWLGGLALLLAAALSRAATPPPEADGVSRFSAVALWCVVTIGLTGLYQSWREVGTLPAVTATPYGRLLLYKVAGFAALVGLGWLSRRYVQARAATRDRQLRRSVGAEAVVAATVLALTAVLVNVAPARTSFSQPFSASLTAGPLDIEVVLDRARVGTTELHLYTLTLAGQQTKVDELTASLTLPAKDIGPLALRIQPTGPGHFTASEVAIPVAGLWRLTVTARVGEFNAYTASTDVRIR